MSWLEARALHCIAYTYVCTEWQAGPFIDDTATIDQKESSGEFIGCFYTYAGI